MSNDTFRYESRHQTLFPLPCALTRREIMYKHYSPPQLKDLFFKKTKLHEHPRVLATATDFENIKQLIKTDKIAIKYFNDIHKKADIALDDAQLTYPDRHTSSVRIILLSFIYKITGDEKYAKRAVQDLEKMCSFSTWTPVEKLDIGYILKGIAVGYDWLYDFLTDEQRERIRTAILSRSFWKEREVFRNPYRLGIDAHNIFQNTNHNVSINCGLIMSACAIFDDENLSEICGEIIDGALWALENYLPEFLEHGSGKEGTYYWYWPMESTDEILSTMLSTFGTAFGIEKTPGIEKTGFFPVYMTGATGYAFNWGNGHPALAYDSHNGTNAGNKAGENHEDMFISPDLFNLARILDLPELSYARARTIEKYNLSASPYDLLWYRPFSASEQQLPNDMYFERTESVGIFSDWEDTNGLSICFKGGFNSEVHGGLGTGAFVMDAMGERWACMLGSERYSVPDYWNYGLNGTRWTYYRMRAEGQNALVINPGMGPDQYPMAFSKMEKYQSSASECFAIVDATPAFANDKTIQRVKRGMALINNRSQIVLQDELTAANADYWFFMHTMADIKIEDGGKQAILQINGKYLHAFLQSNNENARFSISEAKPLPCCPNPIENSDNSPCQKLTVHVKDANELLINITFIPAASEQTPSVSVRSAVRLNQWKV